MARPTQKEIVDGVVARIQTLAPASIVIPRNILATKSDGWLGFLQSPNDGNRIHGWMVTPQGMRLLKDWGSYADYELKLLIWQFLQYSTGSDVANSEDVFNAEREAVVVGFAGQLPEPIKLVRPLEFPMVDLFYTGGELVHIAQGSAVAELTICPS
jgi:hypothetical protein